MMRQHKLKGTHKEWKEAYEKEYAKVMMLRMVPMSPEESRRVLKEEKCVPLRMNPEMKRDGRKKCRLLVRGDLEPKWWAEKKDSPVARSSSVATMLARKRRRGVKEVIAMADVTM